MWDWPSIDEPELLERLAMGDEAFEAFVETLLGSLPRRQYGPAVLARAVAYPGARPPGPFRLADGAVEELESMGKDERAGAIDRFTADPRRHPLLAFGANGSPAGLRLKFAHFADPEDRTALVLTGWLHDFDVCAAAQHAIYGTIPATLFPSPGTAVRAALVWVTATQFTQLVWSEMNYRLGRITARFEVDGVEEQVEEVLAFVSRFGAFQLGGGPVALDAVPARDRTAEALPQRALLDAVAQLVLGPAADAEALLRAAFDDIAATARKAADPVRSRALRFESDRWTPYPAAAELARSGAAAKRSA